MKKMFVLLITMFLSSCQISSNSETPSEQNSDSISTIESVSNLDVLSDDSSFVEETPSTEESSSEEVEKVFNMSRKAFKRALGGLYKDQIVEFDETKTYLVEYKR